MTDRPTRAKSRSTALFGELMWTPQFAAEKLDLTLGLRYTWDDRTATRTVTDMLFTGETSPLVYRQFNGAGTTTVLASDTGSIALKNKKFNPAFTVSYHPSENVTTYAKVVTAYKAGGAHPASPNFTRAFGPESITSYEAGIKADLFDRRLRTNIAAFIANNRDLQIDFSVSPNTTSIIDTFNAGRATIKGVEADISAVPVDGITLQASYSYLTYNLKNIKAPAGTIFDDTVNPSSPASAGDDISGYFVLPFTPKHSVRLSANWNIGQVGPGILTIRGDYTWKDKVFTTGGVGPSVKSGRSLPVNPSYALTDARLTYNIERANGSEFSVSLWGKNIFDKRYPAFNVGLGSILTGYSAQAASFGMPATYGVDLAFKF